MPEQLIFSKISAVMNDISAISKARNNTMQHYNFRGVDDVYNELHDILAKHKVFTVPKVLEEKTEERQSKGGGVLIYRMLKIEYAFFAEDGSNIVSVVIGEGMDSGDKASNKAMSVAHKYCLLQVFAIPTEDSKDPENESPEPLPKNVLSEKISEAQLKLLNTEIGTREIDREKFKSFLKISSMKDVIKQDFDKVLKMVQSKPEKKSREPGEEID